MKYILYPVFTFICFALPVTEVVWEGEEETKPDANLTNKKAENKVANDAVDR